MIFQMFFLNFQNQARPRSTRSSKKVTPKKSYTLLTSAVDTSSSFHYFIDSFNRCTLTSAVDTSSSFHYFIDSVNRCTSTFSSFNCLNQHLHGQKKRSIAPGQSGCHCGPPWPQCSLHQFAEGPTTSFGSTTQSIDALLAPLPQELLQKHRKQRFSLSRSEKTNEGCPSISTKCRGKH